MNCPFVPALPAANASWLWLRIARTSTSESKRPISLSNLPRSSRRRGSAPANDDTSVSTIAPRIPLSKRLPDMSDYQLTAHHRAAVRISGEKGHAKHAIAQHALPMIEAEIRRRTGEPVSRPSQPNPRKGKSE